MRILNPLQHGLLLFIMYLELTTFYVIQKVVQLLQGLRPQR